MEIDIHKLGKLAQILNRMKNRIKAFKDLPQGYVYAERLDIEEIQAIFNGKFAKKENKG